MSDALRDVLRIHHPIMRSEDGPFSGCRCGQVGLGQDVIAHIVEHLGAAIGPVSESGDDGGMAVARIRIERRMMPGGGDAVKFEVDDGHEDGDIPAAVELLGLLAMAQNSVLHGGLYDEDEQ